MNKMDSTLTSMWVSFFTTAGIPSDVAATYALTFAENRIQSDMLLDLNKEYLRDMGITRMGDVIAILRHAKQVHESTARDKVLGSTMVSNIVPVAAITGRATVTQNKPASPASRMLGHYTRNTRETPPSSPTHTHQNKRKIADVNEKPDVKISRLIRFSSPQPTVKEVTQTKQTVFARLGEAEPVKSVTTITTKEVKPIYARLGSKADKAPTVVSAVPVKKDALRYEGILKSPPQAKKIVTITTTKNSVRRIAMACTMRADEQPVSVKEKLSLPKSKSVKFSNHVEYKEIEPVQDRLVKARIQAPKQTAQTVFNKPERRLSMPDGSDGANVKARLGLKKTNTNNLMITKNVFKRLGV